MPYTRTPCVTESSGTGTIDGNITVFHNHVIKFHGDLTYNTTGPDRSVTKGTAWYTDTDKYHIAYSGNGTWARTGANSLTLTGNMSESGDTDNKVSCRFDYKYEPGS